MQTIIGNYQATEDTATQSGQDLERLL
jgi:hypothetical protein